jgi:signal transduction histidine kinase
MDAHETTIYTAVLIAGGVIGAIIIYFFISILGHQKRNQALYKSKILAEITTLEKERTRLAADLHDELGPLLASVKFKIGSLDVHSDVDQETLDRADENLDELIVRIRGIANGLIPHTLLRKGLVIALAESIDRINRAEGLEIRFEHTEVPELSQEKGMNIYRILQEIIHNTIRHARAGQLRVDLKGKGNTLILLTEDDGIGFDATEKSTGTTGLGLRNLLSRTEVLGGTMYLETKPGKGVKYCFEIPI